MLLSFNESQTYCAMGGYMFFCAFSTVRADHHCVGKNTHNAKRELFGLIDSVIH